MDEALKNADSKNNLRLRITLEENGSAVPAPAATQKPEQAAPQQATQPHARPAGAGTQAPAAQRPAPPAPKPKSSGLDSLSLEPIDDGVEEVKEADPGRVTFQATKK
jgi:hypothetical protein